MQTEFDILVARALSGNISPTEQLRLDKLIGESAEREAAFLSAQKAWNEAEMLRRSNDADVSSAWDDLTFRIHNRSQQRTKSDKSVITWRNAAVLALITALSIVIAWFMRSGDENFSTQIALNADTMVVPKTIPLSLPVELPDTLKDSVQKPSVSKKNLPAMEVLIAVTAHDSAMKFSLPDGSVVFLNRNSSVSYPQKFSNGSRRIVLSGEAYFEVTKGKGQFIVQAGNVNIRVLGTSFNVKIKNPDGKTEVSVEEGRVEVAAAEKPLVNPVVLTAGERASYVQGQVAISISKASRKDRWWKRSGFFTKVREFFTRKPSDATQHK